MSEELLCCPFCGAKSAYVERAGTSKASCIVVCGECGCRLESNEVGSGKRWNTRHLPESLILVDKARWQDFINKEELEKELEKRDCCDCQTFWRSSTAVGCTHEEHPQNDYFFDWNMAPRCCWYKKKEDKDGKDRTA